MKFGKRLAAEAARCWPEACLDYKAIKRALKHDLATGDATATTFLQQLLSELNKVSRFYVEKAGALEATLSQNSSSTAALSSEQLSALRDEIRQLIKFVALNYLAVVKAIKKRNRHCKATFGAAATGPALHPLDLLKQEVFFTSPRLAALSTRAELMAAAAAAAAATGPAAALQAAQPRNVSPGRAVAAAAAAAAAGSTGGAVELDDYQCPICLDVLRSPVVLNCTHRFCWGCLVAHCASITGPSHTHENAAAMDAAAADGQQSGHAQGSSCSHQQHQQQPAAASAGEASTSKDGASSSSSSGNSSNSSSKEGLVVLEKLVSAEAGSSSSGCCDYYNCPVCRQPQVLNIDNLTVDPHLSRFVDELRLRLRTTAGSTTSSVASEVVTPGSSSASSSATLSRSSSVATVATAVTEQQQVEVEACLLATESLEEPDSKYLLPRPLPHHAGRLTVLLDLDGTLVSSFTPRRAPRLPPAVKSHLVGVGSSLNPGGVFVVERPGLHEFLQQLAGMAEVVVFTAGLEEYAAPIIDAIDPDNKFIAGRLYRPACTRTAHHQCIKDLHMLGRPLSRTVLVDDTPLAFLHQPANGVPVLGFRGDPDDRLLMEAVLPLLQTLASAPDVRTVLERRFDMMNWFKRHGYPNSLWGQQQAAAPAAVSPKAAAAAAVPAAAQPADAQVLVEDSMVHDDKHKERCLLVFDFDKTLTDWDAGERLVSELAPELLPWLSSLQQPTNFVPITNEVLQEMARRGVSRDKLLTQLQLLGSEMPPASIRMLRWAAQQGLPVRVLSDCNQVFINHILSGAKLGSIFKDAQSKFEVITNAAGFERIAAAQAADAGIGLGVFGRRKASAAAAAPSYRLVIQPRHPESSAPHNCPLCPANLCKGAELRRLRFGASSARHGSQQLCSGSYGRIVYAGDGANDICPALSLGPNDVVLARAGEALAMYAAAAAQDSSVQQFAAPVYVWHTHEELAQLVREHAQAASS